MSRLCQSQSDQELLWCWNIYKIANWKKFFFLILTFLTSYSNANACKNLGWTLHKDFELCTKATWVDNGTVRANLSPHIQCFGSLGCLSFVKSFFHMKKKEKGFKSINWILHVRSFKQRAFTPPWKLHQICPRFWKNVFHFHELFVIYIKMCLIWIYSKLEILGATRPFF